jgi:iron complex outermembrane recepter protein
LRATNFTGDTIKGTSKNYGAQVKTSGEIYKLPAGPLAMAVGLEARKEELTQTMAEVLQTGNLTGYGGEIKDVSGSRKQWAAFTEFNVPIVKTLEGNVAVRYDHYSDFGNTTNPKFSLRWQPARELLLRGSYGTGFLAPSLYQLFTPDISGVTQPGLSDPIRCPVTGDTGFDCQTQFGLVFGGNRALKPEQSEQATFGFVVEPTPNASFSVDYFKINLKDGITNGISPLTILSDLDQFGSLVVRAPPDASGLPGRILQFDQRYINIGSTRIQGLDIQGNYRAPVQSWGRLSFNLSGTYYLRYDVQQPDGTYISQVGTTFETVVTGVTPRWKHYASATWDQGPWSATIAQTYQTAYLDQQTDLDGNERTVGSMSIWDLQGSYAGFKNWKFALGVKNLFDRDPPKSNQQSTFIVGFDPTYYDPRGRFIYGSVTYSFK